MQLAKRLEKIPPYLFADERLQEGIQRMKDAGFRYASWGGGKQREQG